MALWIFLSVYVSLFLSFTYSQKWAIFYFEGSLLFHKYIIRKSVTTNVSFDYELCLVLSIGPISTTFSAPNKSCKANTIADTSLQTQKEQVWRF